MKVINEEEEHNDEDEDDDDGWRRVKAMQQPLRKQWGKPREHQEQPIQAIKASFQASLRSTLG